MRPTETWLNGLDLWGLDDGQTTVDLIAGFPPQPEVNLEPILRRH